LSRDTEKSWSKLDPALRILVSASAVVCYGKAFSSCPGSHPSRIKSSQKGCFFVAGSCESPRICLVPIRPICGQRNVPRLGHMLLSGAWRRGKGRGRDSWMQLPPNSRNQEPRRVMLLCGKLEAVTGRTGAGHSAGQSKCSP
jgi:hypothetical protein